VVNNGSVTPEFNILDRLPTGACVLRNDFSILFWNARLEEWTGISRDAILGTNILKQYPRLNEPRFFKRLESVLEGGLPAIFSSKLHKYFIPSLLPRGQMRQQQTTVTPLDTSDSEVSRALVIIEDVTDLTKTVRDYKAMRDSALEEVQVRIETEERFRTAFNANPDSSMIERLSDGVIIDANESFISGSGYRREEVIGKTVEDLNFLVPPVERNQLLEELFKHWVINNRELQVRPKDGSIITVLTSMCLFNIGGEPHIQSTSKNITELREVQKNLQTSLQEKEVLLKEIHHRVKNNMLTISALLSLQALEAKDERITRMVNESMSRIQAMAMIHETLYSTESMAEIELGAYLANLCERIQFALISDREKILLKTESDEIKLSPDQTIPCALAVNELVSNSVEHAFPGDLSGVITVESRLQGEQEVQLTISDNGIGISDDRDRSGKNTSLGLKLVKALAVDQLNGTFEVTKEGGTKFKITFQIQQ
jgi:PAS domain S-box-containing protein